MSEEIKNTEETGAAETPEIKTEATEPVAAPAAPATEATTAAAAAAPQRAGGYQGRPQQGNRPQYQRNPRFKRKVCKFCQDENVKIDYKKATMLEQFITDRGKILPRRVTGTCSKHQRGVALAIKRARILALLPFVEK